MASHLEKHFPFWRVGLCVKALVSADKCGVIPTWEHLKSFELDGHMLSFLKEFTQHLEGPKELFMGIALSYDEWLDDVNFFSLDETVQGNIWQESPIQTILFWLKELKEIVILYEKT